MNNDNGKIRRSTERVAQVLNCLAFAIIFIFIGLAIIN